MGRNKARTKQKFELTSAQSGNLIWGSLDYAIGKTRHDVLKRCGFQTNEEFITWWHENRLAIKDALRVYLVGSYLGPDKADELDKEWLEAWELMNDRQNS